MGIRHYSNEARPLSLSSRAESDDTMIQVSAPGTTDYPEPPFLLAAERGTSREEIMLCTAKALNSFTVSRGFDGSGQSVHESGSPIEHTVAAIDFREANEHVNNAGSHWSPGDMKMAAYPVTAGSEPAGWLVCDGRTVSRTTYADLFDAIEMLYNTGGETTSEFRLPDLRQSFPMGKAAAGTGSVLGSRGGSNDAQLVTHAHGITDVAHDHTPGAHTHAIGDIGHSVGAGRHNHAGADGFVYAVSIGGPQNHRLSNGVSSPSDNAYAHGPFITYSDVHDSDSGVTVGNHTGLGTGSPSANNVAGRNSGITGTNNPTVTHGTATDKNLPKYQVVNFLIKV